MMDKGTAASKYEELSPVRDSYLQRGRDAACVTIPALVPREGFTHDSRLGTPYQSVGSRGVNALASKLLMALLPPSTPFFKLQVPDEALRELSSNPETGEVDKNIQSKNEVAMARVEAATMEEVDAVGLRSKMAEGFRHLIVTGNALLHLPKGKKDRARIYKLEQYVVERTPKGDALCIVIKEKVVKSALPPEILMQVNPSETDGSVHNTVDVYTMFHRPNPKSKWTTFKEAFGVVFDEATIASDKFEYLPLRWTQVDGESYGRGFVEDFLGDLLSLEALSKAIVTAANAAAKVLFLVRPNGTTRIKVLAEAPSGSIRQGNADDVSVLNLDKSADMRVAMQVASEITGRLNDSFLMVQGATRDAERVTAEEVRMVASELEETLGGTYTVFGDEFQRPLVPMLQNRMVAQGIMPELPKDLVRTSIVTGLEALGRGQDLRRLAAYWQTLVGIIGPEMAVQIHDVNEIRRRVATATGIDLTGLTKSDEAIQQEQQQAQQQKLLEQLGPEAVKQVGNADPEQIEQMRQAVQPQQ